MVKKLKEEVMESCISVRRKEVWKDYMEMIMKEENDWHNNVEGNAVEGPVVCVSREKVLQALSKMKIRKPLHFQRYHW